MTATAAENYGAFNTGLYRDPLISLRRSPEQISKRASEQSGGVIGCDLNPAPA